MCIRGPLRTHCSDAQLHKGCLTPPPPRALLERRGEGGRGSRGGGEPPPPAGMNHMDQELQKCTTLTHSVYTFVIMSEHR